jgi:DNA-directed RNA polymerase specialized sigma24 family protein
VRGLPYQVVATLLGIPEGTVKSRMHHAVRELRVLLGGDDPRA